MNGPSCRQLDDYLDGTLTDGALAAFEAHIDQCDECRGAVVQHREMVWLLRQGANEQERPPARLLVQTRRAMRRHDHRRRVRLVAGLTTAAVLLIGVGMALRWQRTAVDENNAVVESNGHDNEPARTTPAAKSRVRVSVLNPDEAIAVPIETKSENVTIVWIYPTVKVVATGAATSETDVAE
ncbi:MAG: anti-sigma factor [Pirellulales bacterium]